MMFVMSLMPCTIASGVDRLRMIVSGLDRLRMMSIMSLVPCEWYACQPIVNDVLYVSHTL